jgi:hypothetical protein
MGKKARPTKFWRGEITVPLLVTYNSWKKIHRLRFRLLIFSRLHRNQFGAWKGALIFAKETITRKEMEETFL